MNYAETNPTLFIVLFFGAVLPKKCRIVKDLRQYMRTDVVCAQAHCSQHKFDISVFPLEA